MSTAASTGGGGTPSSTGGSGSSTASSTGGSATTFASHGSTASSTGSTATPPWGETWRQHIAGQDAQELARLGRFDSPAAIYRSFRELENKLHGGLLKSTLRKDASQEEIQAWRKDAGIPLEAKDYWNHMQFDDGLVVGDEDKPIFEDFFAAAHKANMHPDQVKEAVRWYYDHEGKQTEARETKDLEIAKKTADVLRGVWPGAEYRANMNAIEGLMAQAPAINMPDGSKVPLKDVLMQARLPDGTPIGSSPEALQFLAHLAKEINPAATVVPAGTTNVVQSIDEELGKLKKMMGNKQSEYWKGPNAAANQARYKQLLEAKEAHAKKAKQVA